MSKFLHIPRDVHDSLIASLFLGRGFSTEEVTALTYVCGEAARHGVRDYSALHALHLDDKHGSGAEGCLPNAKIEIMNNRFSACEVWNANKKAGPPTAFQAIERAVELANQHGIAQISVDNAFHYLWGGAYVLEAAARGYIAYTNAATCPAEVAPFGGRRATLGINPQSWAFPTTDLIGFPLLIDWSTSTLTMDRIKQSQRKGRSLPPNSAIDSDGLPTANPNEATALLPFGEHRGYGLSMVNEALAALIGGSLPHFRGRSHLQKKEKNTSCFFIQVMHPEALSGGNFPQGRTQMENLKAILLNVLNGNPEAILPGQMEANFRQRSDQTGGLLFTKDEIQEFNLLAREHNRPPLYEF